jgi:hypothetical protein
MLRYQAGQATVASGPIGSGDKTLYPVIGRGYIANTNGDGAVCRETPGGDPVVILPEGTEVIELSDGIMDGWQYVDPQTGDTACYVAAEYLSDTPVAAVEESANAEATVVVTDATPGPETQSNGPLAKQADSASVGNVQVTQLPVTGAGSAAKPISRTGWDKWIHENRGTAMCLILVILGGGLVISLRRSRTKKAAWHPKDGAWW